ncbi:MAG: 4-(cytidine 5'-diphospho)-2-C-methyl-D-erythritol kinase [Clostridiales bacterium]|nr:4-(cytidine 5'-diphospho)-2-C-methyl-D-erythritol kinase [Clostridiales bacterium]
MDKVQLCASAKINLTLDVIDKRSDGYHNLRMIMQMVSLYDRITIERTKDGKIACGSNLNWLPNDDRNLAVKAAKIIREKYEIRDGVKIYLKKQIPAAAGLAGGSTDCAAVLMGMNHLFDLQIPMERMMRHGLEIGSDVPYCIFGGTALAEGRGEILTRLGDCPKFYVVLAKPAVSVSTGYVYKHIDEKEVVTRPQTDRFVQALQEGDRQWITKGLCNVLETVTIPMHPIIRQLKEGMLRCGAENAMMSGSGPTVFGLFTEEKEANRAADWIRTKFHLKEVFAVQTCQGIYEI